MNNLEILGLIVVFMLLVLSGGYYLLFSQDNRVHNKLPLQKKPLPLQKEDPDEFETAEEVFPIQFPKESEHEHIPDLPWGYDDDKITAMSRDPEWIFAYWDISEDRRNHLQNEVGQAWDNSLPVIRVHDVTGVDYFEGTNSNHYFDEVVNDYSGNWYVRAGEPDHAYCVELGRLLDDGSFVMMARSNYTLTHRNSVSDRIDPEWMLVSDHEKKLFAKIGHPTGISSGELFNH